jgi:hypothetical protein
MLILFSGRLQSFKSFESLKFLELNDTGINDINQISDLVNLEYLGLGRTNMTDIYEKITVNGPENLYERFMRDFLLHIFHLTFDSSYRSAYLPC